MVLLILIQLIHESGNYLDIQEITRTPRASVNLKVLCSEWLEVKNKDKLSSVVLACGYFEPSWMIDTAGYKPVI